MIEKGHSEISLKRQAALLGISRSGCYYDSVGPSEKEIQTKHRIDEIYTDWPFYGSRRITVVLQKEMVISRKTVQKYMREMGLEAIGPKPNLSKRHPEHKIYPYLLRNVTASYPNHVWGIDITYIRLEKGWMYLVAILDWYSRFVVSWCLDQSLAVDFVLESVDLALLTHKPKIWNSDQGSQFTNPEYIKRLKDKEIKISMDGRGRALDNVFTERLWRSVKYEEVYPNNYRTPREARIGLQRYLEFYNYQRPHQALSYQTPAEVYFGDQIGIQVSQLEMEDSTLF
jgi:putative transposase